MLIMKIIMASERDSLPPVMMMMNWRMRSLQGMRGTDYFEFSSVIIENGNQMS